MNASASPVGGGDAVGLFGGKAAEENSLASDLAELGKQGGWGPQFGCFFLIEADGFLKTPSVVSRFCGLLDRDDNEYGDC